MLTNTDEETEMPPATVIAVDNPQHSCVNKWCFVDCGGDTMTKERCRDCCVNFWLTFPLGVLVAIFLVCVVGFVWSFFIDDNTLSRNVLIVTLCVGIPSVICAAAYPIVLKVCMLVRAIPKRQRPSSHE